MIARATTRNAKCQNMSQIENVAFGIRGESCFKSGEKMLKLAKCGTDLIVGQVRSSQDVLENPMILESQDQVIQPTVAGGKPQIVKGFRLIPLPARKIILVDVSYHGQIDAKDPLAELYARVADALEDQKKSPIMLTQ